MRINKIKDHQKRLCCLKIITVGIGLCLSMQSNANGVEKVLSKNAFNQDAEHYAKEHKVLYSEALRRLIIQNSLDQVLPQLENKYRQRLAGVFLENGVNFKLVVYLTGQEKVVNRNLSIKNSSAVPFSGVLSLPIEFRTGAQYTKTQLVQMLKDNDASLRQAYPNLQAASINEVENSIDLELYDPKHTATNQTQGLKLLSSEKPRTLTNVPLKVTTTNIPLRHSAAVRAAETMLMADSTTSTTFYNCTTGFNVKNAAGTKFATTAAHCKNYKITVDDRKTTGNDNIALTFVGDFWNGSQDFQTMSLVSSTHTLNPEFFASDNVVKTLTGRRTQGNTPVGTYVCHYGMKTGYSCGTVQSTAFKAFGTDNKCGPSGAGVCNATWVKVSGPTLDCWGGDSGGPIFIGSVAAGLLSTATYQGTWSSSMKGQGYCGGAAKPNGYMTYMSTDELYKEGYSLLYGQ
ncbi:MULTISPECIES: S1 family peptidase [unclassified Acinetobacter]|nr:MULTISPECIES: S1 family peptidase [unclassified Acinetobacter]